MILRTCAVLAVVVTACASDAGDQTTSTQAPEPASTTTPSPSEGTFTSIDPSPSTTAASPPEYLSQDLLDEVRELASDEAGIPLEEFDVDIAAQVTWSDGSLGCPQPGQAYTQALVDGYWVVLSHGGETYDYRSTTEEDFRRCLDGQPPASIYEDR